MFNCRVSQAAKTVQQGGVIAYPTEAVWGLGCDPFNADAVNKIIKLKKRPIEKGLILVAPSVDVVRDIFQISKAEYDLMSQPVTRATTYIIDHNNNIPSFITGRHSRVAVRVSKHPIVRPLCGLLNGLLVSTSANTSGAQAARYGFQARRYFGDQVDYYLPGNVNLSARPSRIIDIKTGAILRD